jgi:type I restriction-modification system DNA methylase subunit
LLTEFRLQSHFYFLPTFPVASIHFRVPGSKAVWEHLETASRRSHNDTRKVFDDFLSMSICALAGGTMEEEYLSMAKQYSEGENGKRPIDAIPAAFAALINGMEESEKDILGDIFEGAITFGEHGQFFTPEHLCEMMARMTVNVNISQKRIGDPACGSGRTLLAAAKIAPHNEFIGQDIDLRCVRMTAINLALHNIRGFAIWGNSLAGEQRMVYRTGFNGKGFIANVPPAERPSITIPPPESKAGDQLSLFLAA